MQSKFPMTSRSTNSYANFLRYLLGHSDATKLIAELKASCDPESLAKAKTHFTNGEDVNLENDLRRNRLGRQKWPNEEIRQVFIVKQADLPAFYDEQAKPAAEVKTEAK